MASKGMALSTKLLLAALGGAGLGLRTPVRRRVTPTARKTRYIATRVRRGGRRMSKRRWQAKARREVGVPRNYATSKTAVGFETDQEVVLNQKLKPFSLIRISKGVNINQRLRDTAVVSGVRVQCSWLNTNPFNVFVNWAVVHPKDEAAVSDTQVDFFRDYTNTRAWSANSATKNGLEWNNAAINPDKNDILRRGKFLLGGNTGTMSSSPNKDDTKEMDIFVKLGRSFMWDTEELGSEPYENIYFVFWVASSNAGNGNNVGDGVVFTAKSITYFREPRSG